MLLLWAGAAPVLSQEVDVTARVSIVRDKNARAGSRTGDAVLWLVSMDPKAASLSTPPAHAQLVQKDKSFQPHLLVVPVGSVVEFPNRDPFFHNVFSLFEGKRFDLGLYEAGSSREVRFDKPGISYIFCDIHAEMSAVIVALATPYYGIADRRGHILVPHVPAGRYMVHIWDEAALPQELSSMTREVEVSTTASSLGLFRFTQSTPMAHKNKYGMDYDPPAPNNPAYPQP
jgi:plastocyanin